MEEYFCEFVEVGNEFYIIVGGYRKKGNIVDGKVIIFSWIWKIIVVLKFGVGVRGVDKNIRVIVVDMFNFIGIKSDWKVYWVFVDKIESVIGYDFFLKVLKEI